MRARVTGLVVAVASLTGHHRAITGAYRTWSLLLLHSRTKGRRQARVRLCRCRALDGLNCCLPSGGVTAKTRGACKWYMCTAGSCYRTTTTESGLLIPRSLAPSFRFFKAMRFIASQPRNFDKSRRVALSRWILFSYTFYDNCSSIIFKLYFERLWQTAVNFHIVFIKTASIFEFVIRHFR